MNDRLAFCSYCEDTYYESTAEEHDHAKEIAAEAQLLALEQKGPPTGWSEREGAPFYSHADRIRDGRSMRFMAKGKMRRTSKA